MISPKYLNNISINYILRNLKTDLNKNETNLFSGVKIYCLGYKIHLIIRKKMKDYSSMFLPLLHKRVSLTEERTKAKQAALVCVLTD